MSSELFVALCGIILSVLTYFAGVIRTEKRLNSQDSKERIESVLSKYLDLCQGGRDSGWSAALRSGFGTLDNDNEIREVAKLVEDHGEKYPLTTKENLENVDLKKLFNYVSQNNLGFRNTPIDQLIELSNA
jgi:hypothetical protein